MPIALIVDDDPITRMDLADMLERTGFTVAGQGGDGFDAVELCERHRPDLVLMDIKMPVFDGLDATKTITSRGLAGCVVILTAFNDRSFIDRAKEYGVAGYLVKPVDERMLLPAIEVAMAQSERYHHIKNEHDSVRQRLKDRDTLDRAKAILAKKDGISESEAHTLLRKTAMNKSVSLIELAKSMVDAADDRLLLDKAKRYLMRRNNINEKTAFRRMKSLSEERGVNLSKVAEDIIAEAEK